MENIDFTLNKLKNISENLSSIPTFADFKWENNKRVYKTNISSIATNISSGINYISNSKREKVLLKWKRYLNNEIQVCDFNSKEIEILSFDSSVVSSSEYWDLLIEQKDYTPKTIIGLVYCVHCLWTNFPDLESILGLIQNLIKDIKTDNKVINEWKRNYYNFLSINSTDILAKECLKSNLSVAEIAKKYSINIDNTLFELNIKEDIFKNRIIYYRDNRNIGLNDVCQFVDEINSSAFSKRTTNMFFALIFDSVENTRKEKNESKDFLKELFLDDINYKDPRKNPEKWYGFDDNAKSIFINWLNEQDIKIFFDLFIDYDPHGRKDFWLNYSRRVLKTQILQCPSLTQNIRNSEQIEELKNKEYALYEVLNAQTNAFILEFSDFTVIEFSENGNACYIYNKNDMPIQMSKSAYYVSELKDRNKAMKVVNHTKGWQYDLRNWLALKGVR